MCPSLPRYHLKYTSRRLGHDGGLWCRASVFAVLVAVAPLAMASAQEADNRPRFALSPDDPQDSHGGAVPQAQPAPQGNAPKVLRADQKIPPKKGEVVNDFVGTEEQIENAQDVGAITVDNAAVATGFEGQLTHSGAQVDMSNLVVLPDGRIVPIDQVPPRDELAFQATMSSLTPLRPDQIDTLRRKVDDVDRSASQPLKAERPKVSSINISLAPGGKPPVINTGLGRVTALSFYDITGAPYPVSAVVIGNPTQFKVEAPIPEGNLVTISPLENYAQGNMAITLANQPVPIMVKLEAGRDVIDYRLDMRVAARGPQAPAPLQFVDGAPNTADPVMSAFIDGLPPEGATPLQVDGAGVSVWRLRGQMYVRTNMTLVSPAWTSSAAGAGGLRVYTVPDVPVLLASDEGRLVTLKVTEPES